MALDNQEEYLTDTTTNPIQVTPDLIDQVDLSNAVDFEQLNNQFTIDDIEQPEVPLSKSQIYEDAFYAAGSYSEKDPVADMKRAADDMLNKGYSSIIDKAQEKWIAEQNNEAKIIFSSLISDPTVSKKDKIAAFSLYANGGYITNDLKQKYIQKVASIPLEITNDDQESQNNNILNLDSKIKFGEIVKEDSKNISLFDKIFSSIISTASKDTFKSEESIKRHVINNKKEIENALLDRVISNLKDTAKMTGAELLAAQQFVLEIVPWATNFITQALKYGDLNIRSGDYRSILLNTITKNYDKLAPSPLSPEGQREAAAAGRKATELVNYVYKPMVDYILDKQLDMYGLRKEFNDAIINKGLQYIGEKLEWAANRVEEKTDGAVTKEGFMFGVDLFAIFGPKIIKKGYTFTKSKIRDTYDWYNPRYIEGELMPRDGDLLPEFIDDHTFTDPITGDKISIVPTNERRLITDNRSKSETIDSTTGNIRVEDTPANRLGIQEGSQLDSTIQANPEVGSQLALGVIEDTSGVTGEMLGTDRVSVFASTVLADFERRYQDIQNNPDLRAELLKKDKELSELIDDNKYDPNALDIQQYYSDRLAIDNVVNEARTPYLQLNNSLINPNNFTLEGSLVFGRTNKFGFNTLEQVEAAYNNLNLSVRNLPEKLRGKISVYHKNTGKRYTFQQFKRSDIWKEPRTTARLEAKEFVLEWNFKKEYDALASTMEGLEQHQVELSVPIWGNVNVTNFAMSKFGAEQVFWTQKFPKWVQQGYARQVEKATHMSTSAITTILKEVNSTKYPKELVQLIEELNDLGRKPIFTQFEISRKFPRLSHKAHEQLFKELSYFRILDNFEYELTNVARRYEMTKEGYDKGIFLKNKFIGAVQTQFKLFDSELGAPKYIYDFERDISVPLYAHEISARGVDGWFTKDGRQIVLLEIPIAREIKYMDQYRDPNTGEIRPFQNMIVSHHRHAIISKVQRIRSLPEKVVSKIPGHAYIPKKGDTIIMIEPKQIMIDGNVIPDNVAGEAVRRQVRVAKAIAQNKREASLLKVELERLYPNHRVLERSATEASLQEIDGVIRLHKERIDRAKLRGEKLIGLRGKPPIESPINAYIGSIRQSVANYLYKDIDMALEKMFLESYKDLVPGGKFPKQASDIINDPNFSKQERQRYNKALRLYEYRRDLEFFSEWNSLDNGFQLIMYKLADLGENANISPRILKEFGNQGVPLISGLRQLSSAIAIGLRPLKQWIIQLTPMTEMLAITPTKALSILNASAAIRLAALEDSAMFKKLGPGFRETIYNVQNPAGFTQREFNFIVNEFKKLLPVADLNLLVNDLFRISPKDIQKSGLEKVMQAGINTVSLKPIRSLISNVSRKIGFTNAELWNRLNLYVWTILDYKAKNPGKNFMDKATNENLLYESWRLSSAMSRPGALKWQHNGIASWIAQFFGATYKQSTSLFIKDATVLTKTQNYRRMAAVIALWGVGLNTLYQLFNLDEIEDLNVREAIKRGTRGVVDMALNMGFKLITGEDSSDIDFQSQMNAYDTPERVYDMIKNVYYVIDNDPSTDGRFPFAIGVGTLEEIYTAIDNFYSTKDVLPDELRDSRLSHLAADFVHIIKGWSDLEKAYMAWTLNDIKNKDGVPYGLNLTHADALGYAFGIPNKKESEVIESLMAGSDRSKVIRDLAKQWHKYLVNEIKNENPNSIETKFKKLEHYNTFVRAMQESGKWDDVEIKEFENEFKRLDQRTEKSAVGSVFKFIYEHQTALNNEALDQAIKVMESYIAAPNTDPEYRKSVENLLKDIKNRSDRRKNPKVIVEEMAPIPDLTNERTQ